MKRLKSLTTGFALAAATSLMGCASAQTVKMSKSNSQIEKSFDAGQMAYDADIKAGKCFSVTFQRTFMHDVAFTTNVPCDSTVVSLLTPAKRDAYTAKWGAPKP